MKLLYNAVFIIAGTYYYDEPNIQSETLVIIPEDYEERCSLICNDVSLRMETMENNR